MADVLPFTNMPWDPGKPAHRRPANDASPAEWERHNARQREWLTARQKLKAAEAKAAAKLRPHPNWLARNPGCHVTILAPPPKSDHHGLWEHETKKCGAPVVAFDGTDIRRTGYMYGACRSHLLRALSDDPVRIWLWWDGTPLDRANTAPKLTEYDAELVLRRLGQ